MARPLFSLGNAGGKNRKGPNAERGKEKEEGKKGRGRTGFAKGQGDKAEKGPD